MWWGRQHRLQFFCFLLIELMKNLGHITRLADYSIDNSFSPTSHFWSQFEVFMKDPNGFFRCLFLRSCFIYLCHTHTARIRVLSSSVRLQTRSDARKLSSVSEFVSGLP